MGILGRIVCFVLNVLSACRLEGEVQRAAGNTSLELERNILDENIDWGFTFIKTVVRRDFFHLMRESKLKKTLEESCLYLKNGRKK